MAAAVEDLDGQAIADALVANHATLLQAETRELALAAQWADLHPADSLEPRPVLPGMERPRTFGGPGTPEAGEFCAAELAVLTGRSLAAATALIGDALDLRHRLPELWTAVQAGTVRAWQARHVAKRTRVTGLTLAQAREVDAATTPYLASLSWGRFLDLLEARIVTADPARAEERRRMAELDRFVVTGQSTEHGLKTLIAKASAGEVIYLVAMIDRIADVLLWHGDTSPVGVRRSKALGMLARPADVIALLESSPFETEPARVVEPPRVVEPVETTPDHRLVEPFETARPSPPQEPPVETTQPRRRPEAVLYVHLSRDALTTGQGVARMGDVGPITIGQASEFLAHSHVTIKPVIDLEDDMPVDCYEVPDRMREQLHLRAPASVFPWSPSRSRGMDVDHTVPWSPGEWSRREWSRQARPPDAARPPGQTRIANLGFLTRTEHRIKTHAPGWRHRQPSPGVHEWRTPHGYTLTVDPTGTRRGLDQLDHPGRSAHERAFAQLVDSHPR